MAEMQTGTIILGGQPPLPEDIAPPPAFLPNSAPGPTFGPGQPYPSDRGVPRFHLKAVRRTDGSFANVEFVEILTPGDNKAVPIHKVNDAIRDRYRKYYDLWRQGLQQTVAGTPLEMWPVMTPADVQVLKVNNIFTVEQLVAMADANDHRIPMARTLKRQAQEWLAQKSNADHIEQSRVERDNLMQTIARLEAQNIAMADRLDQMARDQAGQRGATSDAAPAEAPKRGPGRPRKDEAA